MPGLTRSFPHEDEAGLCGFEKRNRNFKGFADLGEKGFWTSNAFPEDCRLVLGESAIDCVSYEVLFPGGRYASIAGGLNPKQPELILQACKAMPAGSEVVSVTHADPEGERYAEVVREMAAAASLPFRVHRPDAVKDWNDVLKASDQRLHSFPAGH
jgi:Toprim-like